MPDRRFRLAGVFAEREKIAEILLSITTGGVRLKNAGHSNQVILQLLKISWHKEYIMPPIFYPLSGPSFKYLDIIQLSLLGIL